MGPFRGPYRGSPLRDPCWWAVTTEVAAHWEEVLMGPFRGGTHICELVSWDVHTILDEAAYVLGFRVLGAGF